jgi:hypothetical protein
MKTHKVLAVASKGGHFIQLMRLKPLLDRYETTYVSNQAMSAREDLWKLYQRQTDTEVKKRVINALFVAGDHERMSALAEKEESAELRMEAIEKLGLMGRQTEAQLKALYKQASSVEVKEAVLKSFFLQDNAEALIELARSETNSDLKKRAVRHLSHMQSKVATDFMLELLNK